jgi:hypothetical protein
VIEKLCCKCKQIKLLSEFHNRTTAKDGKQKTCKGCQKNYSQSEICKVNRQVYYQKNKQAHIERNLKRQYGLDWEAYNHLLRIQNNCCAICHSPDSGSMCSQRLFVDHCHLTEKVRGLLCHHCNTALGLFQDNINILQSAITYVEQRCSSS